jgi:hypothetical protein
VIVESPYRSLLPPLLAYIDAVDESDPSRPITVVLSEFVALIRFDGHVAYAA